MRLQPREVAGPVECAGCGEWLPQWDPKSYADLPAWTDGARWWCRPACRDLASLARVWREWLATREAAP